MFTSFVRSPLLSLCFGHVMYILLFALVSHCGEEVWTEKHKMNDGMQTKISAKLKGRKTPQVKLYFLYGKTLSSARRLAFPTWKFWEVSKCHACHAKWHPWTALNTRGHSQTPATHTHTHILSFSYYNRSRHWHGSHVPIRLTFAFELILRFAYHKAQMRPIATHIGTRIGWSRQICIQDSQCTIKLYQHFKSFVSCRPLPSLPFPFLPFPSFPFPSLPFPSLPDHRWFDITRLLERVEMLAHL